LTRFRAQVWMHRCKDFLFGITKGRARSNPSLKHAATRHRTSGQPPTRLRRSN
jgi:hypothetical protein